MRVPLLRLTEDGFTAIMRKMNGGFRDYLNESGAVLRADGDNIGQNLLDGVVESIVAALSSGKPLLVCGNGGSGRGLLIHLRE